MNPPYSIFSLLATFISLAAAQIPVPDCAKSCISSAVANATTCGQADIACQCTTTNYNLVAAAASACVLSDCGSAGAYEVLDAANAACEAYLTSSYKSATAAAIASPSILSAGTILSGSTTVLDESTSLCGCGAIPTAVPSAIPTTAPSPTPTMSMNGTVTSGAKSVNVYVVDKSLRSVVAVWYLLGFSAWVAATF